MVPAHRTFDLSLAPYYTYCNLAIQTFSGLAVWHAGHGTLISAENKPHAFRHTVLLLQHDNSTATWQ